MRSARRAAWRALVALEKEKVQRLEPALDRRGLARADRALALELARGVERSRLFLDAVLEVLVDRGLPGDPHVRTALRLGAYQLLKLNRIPSYAAVGETVALLPQPRRGFANAVLRRLARSVQDRPADLSLPRREVALVGDRSLVFDRDWLPDPSTEPMAHHAVVHALPAFLVERWERSYGGEIAARLAAAADGTPALFLRANPRLGDGAALRDALAAEGVDTEALDHPLLVRVRGGASPFGGAAYEAGWFVAQDPTSVLAAEALGGQPGETIIDLCAGPGTKSTVLAAAVGPAGRVHAYDVSERRRDPIRDNARRLGFEEVIVVHDNAAELPVGDRVLADVPCSNTGVLARRVEVRRRLRDGALGELVERQKVLLRRALELVRPGGMAVYSTCSIEPEENEQVVEASLGAGHRVLRQELTLPDPPNRDGGFFAAIEVAAST